MKRLLLIFVLAVPASAVEREVWKEPTIGQISPTGTAINVENYHCKVVNPRVIQCLNVGRVCVEKRARDNVRSARRFGCAIEGNPNYPCPPDDPVEESELKEIGSCWPMVFGGF